MAYLVHRRCRGARKGKEEECQKVASTYEPGTRYTVYLHPCYMHTWTPFFVRPGYVGQETAREVVEAWYKIIGTWRPKMWNIGDLIELQHIIRRDVFFVGLDPSKFLRTLTLDLHTESLFTSRDGESTQDCIDSLLSIKRKTDFKLIILLRQRNISFNSWSTAFDALRHVVTVFEAEGAHVEATFTYDKESLCPKITWDLLPALKSGNDDWRAEAERYLNSDSRLRSRHKVYHQASNIADTEHSDESEYDPNDDVEPKKDTLSDDSDFNMSDSNMYSFINALPHLGRGDPFYGTYLEPHDFKPPPPPKIRRPAWEDHILWNE
ncbi:uncharacterized protein J4E92_005461 [Alternaria infectoria]|uniref:uncharacterized protein n=1 Tax=Alternaria infectoria TaxID=45303 RepID=UPI00221F606D|nr:uncharacterized protein J4E92_005461 [Alternaria infectoria]KAI4927980.1 hypothetical protein J4E92_005461 [Alternaria infectoria]